MMNLSNTVFTSGQKLTILFQKLTLIIVLFGTISLHASDKNRLILGLTGVALKEDVASIVNLKRYLENKTKYNISFKFIKSYAGMKTLLLKGSIDFAYICGSTYVDLKPSKQIELLVLPTLNGKPLYESLIIAKKNTPYKSLFDLKGKVFALSDPESNSASLVPQYMIYKKGFDYSTFFKKIIFTYDHGESIDAVLSGYVDGASVDSVVYKAFANKNPKKAAGLKVISRFGYYPIPPFVVKSSLEEAKKKRLVDAFIDMKNDRLGKKVLKSMAIDGFILPKNISYKKISKIKEYLKKKSDNYDK